MSGLEGKPFAIPKQPGVAGVEARQGEWGCRRGGRRDHRDVRGRISRNNLYKIWNRMSSGTYFPPPVRAVEIPKSSGGTRMLGVPTVGDRVAQTVAALALEPRTEAIFHEDSYGYRPRKGALDAVAQVPRAVLGEGLGDRS